MLKSQVKTKLTTMGCRWARSRREKKKVARRSVSRTWPAMLRPSQVQTSACIVLGVHVCEAGSAPVLFNARVM